MKKSISLLLAATMLCMLVSFSASAEVIEATYIDENGCIYLLSSDYTYYNVYDLYIPSPKVVIPAEVNGLPVKGILPKAFEDSHSITNVTISDSVIWIGERAFYDCENLLRISLGNSVTEIGHKAFYDCKNLTSITIPDSVTTIGEGVFYNCDGLTDIYCEAPSQPDGWNSYWLGDCDATVHWRHANEREKNENGDIDFESIELIVMLAFVGIILTLFMVILVIIIGRINNRQKITKG